jgi:hypothetical protein
MTLTVVDNELLTRQIPTRTLFNCDSDLAPTRRSHTRETYFSARSQSLLEEIVGAPVAREFAPFSLCFAILWTPIKHDNVIFILFYFVTLLRPFKPHNLVSSSLRIGELKGPSSHSSTFTC